MLTTVKYGEHYALCEIILALPRVMTLVWIILNRSARRLSENALSESLLTCPNSSDFPKNNARNIKHMAVLIFYNYSILNKMPILGQTPMRLSENALL